MHETDSSLTRLKQRMAHLFDNAVVAHDKQHLLRVEANAVAIAEGTDADMSVIRAPAWLHDYHRLLESRTGRHVDPEEAEPEIRAMLEAEGWDGSRTDAVCTCVRLTEKFRCASDLLDPATLSLEAKVVRDADMLDALGAVGIARAFMFGGFLREPLYAPDEAIGTTFVPGASHSVVHHFHEKLLRLEEEFLTRKGRIMAQQRTSYMRQYLVDLMREIAV